MQTGDRRKKLPDPSLDSPGLKVPHRKAVPRPSTGVIASVIEYCHGEPLTATENAAPDGLWEGRDFDGPWNILRSAQLRGRAVLSAALAFKINQGFSPAMTNRVVLEFVRWLLSHKGEEFQ